MHNRTRPFAFAAAVGAALLLAPLTAAAQQDEAPPPAEAAAEAQPQPDGQVEEIVVTGSLIRGTPIDAESPVTILDREALEKQNFPSIVEMVRRLSSSSGVDGESNQFDSNASEGTANINIRGLGPHRTLVLLNGKRISPVAQRLPGGRFVDVNHIPAIALRRTEVLKEGAAATYGSDAIGGVVNFLTRENFTGVEIAGSYQDIQDSDGDQAASIIIGHEFENLGWHVVSSLAIQERNQLRLADREFSTIPLDANPEGGYSSIGNPGVLFNKALTDSGTLASPFLALSSPAGGVRDPNCAALGGVAQSLFCRFRYTDFDNLIENEDRWQWFTEMNGQIGDTNFHIEYLLTDVSLPNWATSPSYPPQALFGGIQSLPPFHPGLLDMHRQNPGLYANYVGDCTANSAPGSCGTNRGDGTFISSTGFVPTFYGRIVGVGGRPGGDPRFAKREHSVSRISLALDGEFANEIGWEIGFTHSKSKSSLEGVDAEIGKTKLAFNGYGGDNCRARISVANDGTFGDILPNGETPGQGNCHWYNPFSNAIQTSQSAFTPGAANPQYSAAVANSQEVLDYLDDHSTTDSEFSLLVWDLLFQGEYQLMGRDAAWAAGYQYRRLALETQLSDRINLAVNPCKFRGQTADLCDGVNDPQNGSEPAGSRTGLRSFLAGADTVDSDQDVHALFLETALHITDDFDVQIAARYENYGDTNTFDPKIAARYGVTDWLTLRASAQSTFRGPDLDATSSGSITRLDFIGATGAFKAVDVAGNPSVEPEEALTFNVGFILSPLQGMRFTLDYWNYDFDNPIIVESSGEIAAAFGAGGDRKAAIQSQVFCTGLALDDKSCSAANIERIQVQTVNGPSIQTSGLDFFMDYEFDFGPGTAILGFDGSHIFEYEVEAYYKGGVLVSPAYDGVGHSNTAVAARPLPDLKMRGLAEYNFDIHTFLFNVNYITDYIDDRDVTPSAGFAATTGLNPKVKDQLTYDFHYSLSLLEGDATVNLSMINISDEDPPLAREDVSYDPYTHNAFGRMVKLGLRYHFTGL